MRIFFCFLLLAALVGFGGAATPPRRTQQSAQPSRETLSDDDSEKLAREAQEMARRFAERLRETRDFGPLIEELFAERFLECHGRAMLEGKEDGIFSQTGAPRIADSPVRPRAEELSRRLVAWLNFFYLKTLHRLSTRDLAGRGDEAARAAEEEYPPGVSDLLTRNAEDELTTLERAAALMREHFIAHPPEETAVYQANMRLVGEKEHDRKFWEVGWFRISEEQSAEAGPCFDRSAHTLAVVKVPPFYQLLIARAGGRLRVWTLLCTEPPCAD